MSSKAVDLPLTGGADCELSEDFDHAVLLDLDTRFYSVSDRTEGRSNRVRRRFSLLPANSGMASTLKAADE